MKNVLQLEFFVPVRDGKQKVRPVVRILDRDGKLRVALAPLAERGVQHRALIAALPKDGSLPPKETTDALDTVSAQRREAQHAFIKLALQELPTLPYTDIAVELPDHSFRMSEPGDAHALARKAHRANAVIALSSSTGGLLDNPIEFDLKNVF